MVFEIIRVDNFRWTTLNCQVTFRSIFKTFTRLDSYWKSRVSTYKTLLLWEPLGETRMLHILYEINNSVIKRKQTTETHNTSRITYTPNQLLYDSFISKFHTLIFFPNRMSSLKRHGRFVNTSKNYSKMQMCGSNYKKTSQIVPQPSPFCMFIMKKVNKILLLMVSLW